MSCGCWQCCVQTRNGDKCRTIRDMGRRAIGMEVERKYCEHAIERLAQKKLF